MGDQNATQLSDTVGGSASSCASRKRAESGFEKMTGQWVNRLIVPFSSVTRGRAQRVGGGSRSGLYAACRENGQKIKHWSLTIAISRWPTRGSLLSNSTQRKIQHSLCKTPVNRNDSQSGSVCQSTTLPSRAPWPAAGPASHLAFS